MITGLASEPPQGEWIFMAEGDGGAGITTVHLADAMHEVPIPFIASNAAFEIIAADTFAMDSTIAFQLRSLHPLQQYATYSVMLFPQRAATLDENITFSYRFGTDPETMQHAFYPWEFDLPPGDYEIVIMDDSFDLGEKLCRFSVRLVETLEDVEPRASAHPVDDSTSPPSFGFSQVAEPLRSGSQHAFLIHGPLGPGDHVLLIGLGGRTRR
ncbi:hypothetical protein [Phaeobacter sp. S60]|uniref:hypothetical protein n=1 Tax=Phaeobacter sp. S60 TaxID=1569353 RepID=UPI0011128502|nr:hypothetical protein [Phaeobacter sp. S60]